MASSGVYSWSPSAGDLTLQAFRRCGVKRVEITAEHLMDAATEANLLQVEWSSRQPNWFLAETYEVELTASQATETLPERIIAPLAVYISTTSGSTTSDRIITPLSTEDYHALPNKDQEGVPTSYWFDRQIEPQMTLWPVPDAATTYTLKIRALARPEDVLLKNGTTLDMPYRWFDAFTSCLAYRLAVIYAPERAVALKAVSDEAWRIAAKEDREHDIPFRVAPVMSGYFR